MEKKMALVMPEPIEPIGTIPVVSGEGKINDIYDENKEEQQDEQST